MTDRDEIKAIVKESIRTETGYSGPMEEQMSASEIEGWDSLAHVRIMFRIDLNLGTQIDINQTYAIETISELVDLFLKEL